MTDVTDYTITTLGWVFMLSSIGGVWLLAFFCYRKLLSDDD